MIEFRIASIKDLDLLLYWDTKQHMIDSDPDDDWDWEIELKRAPDWRQ
jgi:aminoglycoside 6'-N-acetyltransferase